MFGGMFILIWSSTGGPLFTSSWWNDEAKLAVTFSIVFLTVLILFIGGSVSLYSWEGQDDADENRQDMDARTRDS